MRETTSGKITATRKTPVGTNLAQAHAAGATTLVVADPFPFDEDGGTLAVNGVTYTYTGWDDDADTIALTTGLTTAAEAGDAVLLLPLESEMVAIVVEDESGEQIEADVRHADASSLPEGPVTAEVTASLVFDGDRWLVDDIIARTPTPDAGMLTGTLPDQVFIGTTFAAELEQALIDIVQQGIDVAEAAADASSALGAATAAQTSANGKNTVTYSTSAPSGTTNGNGTAAVAGDVWFQRAGAIIIGQWEFKPGDGWVARTLDNAVIANLDAGKITSGYLDVANRLKAGSITTPLLAVTGANVFPDPEFQNTDWLVPSGTVLPATPSGRFSNGTGWDYYTAGNGARAVRYTVPAGAADGYFNVFPTLSGASQAKEGWLSVEEGSAYLLRFAHFKTATRHKVYANWVKPDGTTGNVDFIDRETGTAWVTAAGSSTTFRSYILTVPAGVTRIAVRVQVQGTAGQTWAMYGQGITLSRMGDGNLIVDGALTAAKADVGLLTALIARGDVMIAGTPGGQRIQLSTAGLGAYSASNALTASLAAASGGLLLGGDLRVGGAAGISIDNGGSLHLNGGGQMNINDGGQLINWGTSTVTQVMSGELTVSTRSGSTLAEYPRTRLLTDRLTFDRTSTVTTSLRLDVNNDLLLDAPRDAWLRGTSRVVLAALGGDLDLRTSAYVTSTAIRDFQAATTNSRQVWVNISTGRLHTPSSARRMKRDFRPLVLPDPYAVLDLEPTLYRNKAEVAEWEANGTFTRTSQVLDDDGQPVLDEEGYPVELVEEVPLPEPGWEIGLVADDVEQIPGMEPFVQYDDGLTSGLHYDRMWESLIPALRDIVRRLDLIEGAP